MIKDRGNIQKPSLAIIFIAASVITLCGAQRIVAQSEATASGSFLLNVGTADDEVEIFSSPDPVDVLLTIEANTLDDINRFSRSPVVIPHTRSKVSLKADGVELKIVYLDGTSRTLMKRGVRSITVSTVGRIGSGIQGSYRITLLAPAGKIE